ncbi:TerC/Alx family metal homeostasis membrane protein [Algoriphagus sp.]|jgi:tellurite resistance protein TerC|uniref:TerC/Alx family metal homeostasis membrane protein n=1 Tax=Algoriphagus sp. TaxID=1872435 RepID=UPI00271A82E2|nr:TerC/Alx family metal homeostasis membrane protein [Algoriphagus sp.]MDO8967181.1 TerC/Alx family metal homeostasis membrane protein [Algoriphagus sp.]MDP3199720.1 TerC/Alx family metal homeostasis membrane protein [Algoriphagus sp.]
MDSLINHPGILIGFALLVAFMLLLDLGIFNKKSHIISNKEAAIWSVFWIGLSMIFSIFIYIVTVDQVGLEKFSQFQSAYWIEKALSVDNLFVFILVFGFFNVPREYHHKVLFWGILGALVMRAIFIFAGVGIIGMTYLPEMTILERSVKINVVLTVFGIFLVYAGYKSWFAGKEQEGEKDYTKNPGARLIYKYFKVTPDYHGDKFFVIKDGVKMATPLLVVLAVIEFTDLIFAVDSIPAIFAIAPDDPFILYTSNIFAILGLRSLYFLLANFIHMFSKLKYGLAIILVFIGLKMVSAPLYHFSSTNSLAIVGGILLVSIAASVIWPEEKQVGR